VTFGGQVIPVQGGSWPVKVEANGLARFRCHMRVHLVCFGRLSSGGLDLRSGNCTCGGVRGDCLLPASKGRPPGRRASGLAQSEGEAQAWLLSRLWGPATLEISPSTGSTRGDQLVILAKKSASAR